MSLKSLKGFLNQIAYVLPFLLTSGFNLLVNYNYKQVSNKLIAKTTLYKLNIINFNPGCE